MNNDRVTPINVQAQKWYLAYFGPWVGYSDLIFLRYRLQICLPLIYIKFYRQTKLEVNQTWNYHFSLQKAS